MTDDPGVMGNLPRSRPGRRSDKRAAAGGTKPKGPAAAKASGARKAGATRAGATAKRSGAAAKRSGAAAKRTGTPPPRAAARPARPARGPDPVGDAVRIAAKVAGTGLGIATGILRRLPRP